MRREVKSAAETARARHLATAFRLLNPGDSAITVNGLGLDNLKDRASRISTGTEALRDIGPALEALQPHLSSPSTRMD